MLFHKSRRICSTIMSLISCRPHPPPREALGTCPPANQSIGQPLPHQQEQSRCEDLGGEGGRRMKSQ